MSRKDVFGVEVEVGDIVFSAPRHKWSGSPEIGQVCGVFESGRVTIKLPSSKPVYAYQEGAPDKEVESFRWDRIDGQYVKVLYKYVTKDYTVVRRVPYWLKKQAADITLVVLRKNGEESKSIEEMLGLSDLKKAISLDYSAAAPELD